jgi:hypothetical protein
VQLGWICDVAQLLARNAELRWDAIVSGAEALGARRMCRLGLDLARRLLRAPLPAPVQRWVDEDPVVAALTSAVRSQLPGHPESAPAGIPAIRFQLAVRERLRDKLRYCVRMSAMPSEEDVGAISMPAWLSGSYYVVRPVRLIAKYGRRLLST